MTTSTQAEAGAGTTAEATVLPRETTLQEEAAARRGKIARLPEKIREEVNTRLQNGQPAREILAWLNALQEVKKAMADHFNGQPIGEENLSRWRTGGYQAWEDRQATLEAVVCLAGQTKEIQEASQEGLAERVALILTAKMAVKLEGLESMPEGESKERLWRELLRGVVLLRRGDFHAKRLELEKERFALRMFRNEKELEEAFWKWLDKPEHKARVLKRIRGDKPPSKAEQKRAMEDRVRRMKSALGIQI